MAKKLKNQPKKEKIQFLKNIEAFTKNDAHFCFLRKKFYHRKNIYYDTVYIIN